jgi:hypothetical protein
MSDVRSFILIGSLGGVCAVGKLSEVFLQDDRFLVWALAIWVEHQKHLMQKNLQQPLTAGTQFVAGI